MTGAYDHADTETRTDRGVDPAPLQALVAALSPTLDPFAPRPPGILTLRARDSARSITDGANLQILANGPLVRLPAGPLYASFKAGDTESRQASSATRLGVAQNFDAARNDAQRPGQSRPPADQREATGSCPVVGDLSLNLNAAVDRAFGFRAC